MAAPFDGFDDVQAGAEIAADRALADLRRRLTTQERARTVLAGLLHHARRDADAVLAAIDMAAMGLRDRLPEPVFRGGAPYFAGMREECEGWAEFASDGQIAAMLTACLDRIGGIPVAMKDRKRLMVALWNGLTPEDRRAFLARVGAEKNQTGA